MSQTHIRAAIYVRTATSQELTPNFALAEQIHQCKAYAAQKGYSLEAGQVYQEVGSGLSEHRPILQTTLAAAKAGQFDILLVSAFDRLARENVLGESLVKLFAETGVSVESVSEPLAGNLEYRMFLVSIHETVAQIQREKRAARSQYGKRTAKARKEQ